MIGFGFRVPLIGWVSKNNVTWILKEEVNMEGGEVVVVFLDFWMLSKTE